MVKIKVIVGGCGIEYTDNHGNTRHALKTPEDGPFDCREDVAERLVSLGVDAKDCKKKEDYVNLILSADSDGEDDEEEEPPALEGMEPV